MIQPPLTGALVDFPKGTLIFKEGDPGGDLYFIKAGQVEVFKSGDGVEVSLAMLSPGEVLGIMTCLTREPRLASARATTEVKALIVKQAGIHALISKTPPWIHAVIKDFTLRIKTMDDLYWKAVTRLERQERDATAVMQAAILANGLSEVGALVAPPPTSGSQQVSVDKVLTHMSRIIGAHQARLKQMINIFCECWLIGDVGVLSSVVEVSEFKRLAPFAAFVQMLFSSHDTRERYETLLPKECAFLLSMVDMATFRGAKADVEHTAPLAKILPDGYPIEFGQQAVNKASGLGLVKLESTADDLMVTFLPTHVLANVRSFIAVQKLRQLDGPQDHSNRSPINALTETF